MKPVDWMIVTLFSLPLGMMVLTIVVGYLLE